MNKIQFEQLLKPLIDIYDEIELELIKNILIRLKNYDSVQGSLKWYLDKQVELGLLDKKNLEAIKNNKEKIEEVIKCIVHQVGNHIDEFDLLDNYYKEGLLDINPNNLYNSTSINNLIKEALKDTTSIMDLINTKALESSHETYMKIINKAYIETASGIYTYTESIRHGIDEFAKNGITVATYESGKALSIESIVRRDVITRMNKLVGSTVIEHAKQLGTNLVYVDQHLGARTRTKYMKHDYEAHAEWQGKKYMIEGSNNKYGNLYEKTGYGEMLGLKGLNCYHNMRPTWEWEEIPDRIDEDENAKKYELFQKQREFERKIRKLKIDREIAKGLDDDGLSEIKTKLSKTNKEYDEWLKDNGLRRDYNREYISTKLPDFSLEEEYFKDYEGLDKEKEHLIIYDKNTGKRIGNICSGINNQVKPDFKTLYKLISSKKDSLIVTHNHPKNTSFSLQDFKTFNNTKSINTLVVRTDEYIYAVSGNRVKDTKILEECHSRIKKEIQKENLNIIEERHKINTLLAKEMGWKYGRFKNNSDD